MTLFLQRPALLKRGAIMWTHRSRWYVIAVLLQLAAADRVCAGPLAGLLLTWPVPSATSSVPLQDYAQFNDGSANRHHAGIDIPATLGSPVVAAAGGTVRTYSLNDYQQKTHCFGNVVMITHSNGATLYGHLASISVVNGQQISQGQQIGTVGNSLGNKTDGTSCGSTGAHLHFELKDNAVLATTSDELLQTWGYSPELGVSGLQSPSHQPDAFGYHDPVLNLHSGINNISVTTVVVTSNGGGVSLRTGPQSTYRSLGMTTSMGQQFTAIRERTSASTGCDAGWYQVAPIGGEYFVDSNNTSQAGGTTSVPDAWICKGNGGQVWLAPTSSANQSYTLSRGLNLIAFPFVPTSGGSSLFSNIFSSISADVFPYAFFIESNGGVGYGAMSSLNAQAKTGYFVSLSNPRTLAVSGSPTTPGITLHKSVNLVGVTQHVVPPFNAAVFPTAYRVENGAPIAVSIFSSGLDPGIGYFVFASFDGVTLVGESLSSYVAKSDPIQTEVPTFVAPSLTAASAFEFSASITIQQSNAPNTVTLQFGTQSGATDGYDQGIDVLRDIPVPGNLIGFFDDSFGFKTDLKAPGSTVEWPLNIWSQSSAPAVSDNLNPVQLSWSIPLSGNLDPNTTLKLLDSNRNVIVQDMLVTTQTSFSVPAPGTGKQYIVRWEPKSANSPTPTRTPSNTPTQPAVASATTGAIPSATATQPAAPGCGAQTELSWSNRAVVPASGEIHASVAIGTNLYTFANGGFWGTWWKYSSTSNSWTQQPDLPGGCGDCGVAAIGNRIYVISDGTDFRGVGSVTQIFDATTSQWTFGAAIPVPLRGPAVSAVNGKVYAIGGWDGMNRYGSVSIYDPSSNSWTSGASMPTARAFAATAVLDGKIYVISGASDGGISVPWVEIYDPVADQWTSLDKNWPPTWIPTRRKLAIAGAIGCKIYVAGGLTDNGSAVSAVEELDPVTQTWSTKTSLKEARFQPGGGVVGSNLVVAGGLGGSNYIFPPLESVESGTFIALPTSTPTQTYTKTPTHTATTTTTRTPTVTPGRSPTRTPSLTPSVTPTASLAPTLTATATLTPTRTLTATLTPTRTLTTSPSATSSPSGTPTRTPSLTATQTATSTPSRTPTSSPSATSIPSTTATRTPSMTATQTATSTPTRTPTSSPSATSIPSATATRTPSVTATRTATSMPTRTPTSLPSATSIPSTTATRTPSVTATPTATSTPTSTPTSQPSATSIPSATATGTPSVTETPTASSTATRTPTESPTAIASLTPTTTPTAVPTATASITSSPTPSQTPTQIQTNTVTSTNTLTPTATATLTSTASPSVAASPATAPSGTATMTLFPSSTATITPSATSTSTSSLGETITPTNTVTGTPTQLPTASPTDVPTASATETVIGPVTSTPTQTVAATTAQTATATAVRTSTPSGTPVVAPTFTTSPSRTSTLSPSHTPTTMPSDTPQATATPTVSSSSTPITTATSTTTVGVTASATPSSSATAATAATQTPTATRTATIDASATPTIGSPLGSPLDDTSTTVIVENIDSFPGSGVVQIDEELLSYNGKEPLPLSVARDSDNAPTRGRLRNVTRGVDNSQPANHLAGVPVTLVARACPGDCDRDQSVRVDEILVMVNVALGRAHTLDCPPGDIDGSDSITVDELVRAVNGALMGCEEMVGPTVSQREA